MPADLKRILDGNVRLGEDVVGIDPAVNLSIDLALGEGLLKRSGDRIELSGAGQSALARIKESGALEHEIAILADLPKVSNARVERALRGRQLA